MGAYTQVAQVFGKHRTQARSSRHEDWSSTYTCLVWHSGPMTTGDQDVTDWDFFVSYQQADRGWAEWIAWQLENAGHSVLFQGWDFVPGTNWIKLMQDGVSRSARVIAVLSDAYIDSVFGAAEWQTIWALDPTGARRRVIPVRVADCEQPGLLAGIVGIDLFGIPEPKALQRLQDAINRALAGRAKPLSSPSFPVTAAENSGAGTKSHADTGSASVPRTDASTPDAQRPRFPGRKYQVDVRGGQGIQIGDGNTQINRW